jgi:hypothetical protein
MAFSNWIGAGAHRAEMHQPDRLLGGAAAGTGDASHRDSDVGVRARQGTRRHGTRDRIAHRAMAQDGFPRHTQHFALGLVRVGDEGAVDHVG